MTITLGHNQGLGDCILMNGAIRYLAERHGSARYLCVAKNLKFLNHLYRYDANIILKNVGNRGKVTRLYKNQIEHNKRHRIRHHIFNWSVMSNWTNDMRRIGLDPNHSCWCEAFYKMFGVPYSSRYAFSRFIRHKNREENLINQLGIAENESYAFVVDNRKNKISQRSHFQLKHLPSGCRIINPNNTGFWRTTFITDWMSVIENAKEIHTIDTSWFHLIKQMRLDIPRFYHRHPYRLVPATTCNYVNDEWDKGWQVVNY